MCMQLGMGGMGSELVDLCTPSEVGRLVDGIFTTPPAGAPVPPVLRCCKDM
ncbi:hypothetical protein LCGC14_0529260 [marine sediment metagenome]|uniref:Uncharacterized protein n=1 Tax=marine sediment metagenome TaxID=412755 RepID=A0A0F9SEI3_9ZZZZ